MKFSLNTILYLQPTYMNSLQITWRHIQWSKLSECQNESVSLGQDWLDCLSQQLRSLRTLIRIVNAQTVSSSLELILNLEQKNIHYFPKISNLRLIFWYFRLAWAFTRQDSKRSNHSRVSCNWCDWRHYIGIPLAWFLRSQCWWIWLESTIQLACCSRSGTKTSFIISWTGCHADYGWWPLLHQ